MNIDNNDLVKNLGDQLEYFKENKQFDKIAGLLTYVLNNNLYWRTKQVFGYIPGIFPVIEIPDPDRITTSDLCIGEPVVYKIHYGNDCEFNDIPFYYLFCFFKEHSRALNVYFQSANDDCKNLSADDYALGTEKIRFEGSLAAFNDGGMSVISISDPGQFIPGFTSGYYAGSREINFSRLIAGVLETLCGLSGIPTDQTMLFGNSAGSMGALLSSSYFGSKVNVMAVNSQIHVEYKSMLMEKLFGTSDREQLFGRYGDQISCLHRFRQEMPGVPNIYLLANINDQLYGNNWEFYRLYQDRFSCSGMNNQSVFDSYVGIDGHGAISIPAVRAKIRIAREVLTMDGRTSSG